MLHSALPEVVGKMPEDWQETIPPDCKVKLQVVIDQSPHIPELDVVDSKAVHYRGGRSFLRGALTEEELGFMTPVVAELIAVTDADYRRAAEIEDNTVTRHAVDLRRGIGNLASLRQALLIANLPFYQLKTIASGLVHADGQIPAGGLAYTGTYGPGTRFWRDSVRGDFGSLWGYVRGWQVDRKYPDLISRDDELLRFERSTLHQPPKYRHDPENPRGFFRDIVSLDEMSSAEPEAKS